MFAIYTLFNCIIFFWGKYYYRVWINPITLYSFVWQLALSIHQSGLILFYDLNPYTWFVIITMQLLFVTSSILGYKYSIKLSVARRTNLDERYNQSQLKRLLTKYIILTTVISGLSTVLNLIGTIRIYGSNLLNSLTDIYASRVYESQTVEVIPYIGSFIYIALPLIGVYLKKYGFNPVVIPAFIIVIMNSLTSGGRAGIVFSLILVIAAYYSVETESKFQIPTKGKVILGIGILFFIFALTVISLRRNVGQSLTYATTLFHQCFGNNLLLYKTMTYIAGPIGVLNEYLKTSDFHFAQNTFLIIYNLLFRLGLGPRIEQYQEWFYTPLSCNVGTWIRELIEDFTIFGALPCACLFGYISSNTFKKAHQYISCKYSIIWSILCLVIILSFFDWKLRSSNIWIAIIFGYLIGGKIDRSSRVTNYELKNPLE